MSQTQGQIQTVLAVDSSALSAGLCLSCLHPQRPCSLGKGEVWVMVPHRAGPHPHFPAAEKPQSWSPGLHGERVMPRCGRGITVHCRGLKQVCKGVGWGGDWRRRNGPPGGLTERSGGETVTSQLPVHIWSGLPAQEDLSSRWNLLFYVTLVPYQKPLAFGSQACFARFTPARCLELEEG